MTIRSKIVGTGSYLPEKSVTNDDLSKSLETSHEWIVERTGICKRYIADYQETPSMMGFEAGSHALKASNLSATDIDGIIVATTTPEFSFPSTAVLIQAKLGAKNAFAFDVQAVCSGFLYALSIADSMIKSGAAKNILVIGTEKMSNLLDWTDRKTCVLFGDGAGAVVLSKTENSESGIIDYKIYSDGSLKDILYTTGGVATTKDAGYIVMDGKGVFKHAIEKMCASTVELLTKNSISSSDVTWVVPHQANLRIISAILRNLDIAEDRAIVTVDQHANTSAASIPLALDKNKSRFKHGDTMLLTAAGGGFTWGSLILKW